MTNYTATYTCRKCIVDDETIPACTLSNMPDDPVTEDVPTACPICGSDAAWVLQETGA